ncbi:MAG: hypothetical protein NTV68_16320 [Methanomicrobiales archaeon]|nr:hypothetical protein [Methanomicrobiales archaeon]
MTLPRFQEVKLRSVHTAASKGLDLRLRSRALNENPSIFRPHLSQFQPVYPIFQYVVRGMNTKPAKQQGTCRISPRIGIGLTIANF